MPAAELTSFRGILNSTTNLILTRMEAGESYAQALAYAQSIGIAETDPSGRYPAAGTRPSKWRRSSPC